eukprot:Amastigsp_a848896_8.p1 type:complete len:321 gc:universal Amastigsp_a848896_8:1-963(+)
MGSPLSNLVRMNVGPLRLPLQLAAAAAMGAAFTYTWCRLRASATCSDGAKVSSPEPLAAEPSPDDGWAVVQRVMDGYVTQDGAVCAAASVAGAWNAAFGFALVDHRGKPNDGNALCARDILDVYEKLLGASRTKLYRNKGNTEAKLSTWCVGNPMLLKALAQAHTRVRNGDTDLRLSARVLLDASDLASPADEDAAWGFLLEHMAMPRVVLLFHTKNHYCLISATRQRADGVREIRTAPKGQVPITPMSWAAACEIIRRSSTYKIIRVEGYSETNPAISLSDAAAEPPGRKRKPKREVPVTWIGGEPADDDTEPPDADPE